MCWIKGWVIRNHINYSSDTIPTKNSTQIEKKNGAKGRISWQGCQASRRNITCNLIEIGLGKNFLGIETTQETKEIIDMFI